MGLQTDQDPTCLESALHSFLSSVPGSVSRSRKPVYSGASPCSQSVKVEAGPRPLQERPGKLNKNEEPENKDQGGKVPELRKVLRLQNNRSSLNNDIFSEKPQKNPSTPRTPQPRNCDYFFTNGECVDSPWTVVSPVTPPCEKNTPDQKRPPQAEPSIEEDTDDCIWESVEVSTFSTFSSEESVVTTSVEFMPVNLKSILHGPIHRSVSVDETRQSAASAFWFGDFFQKSISQRSYSSGSRRNTLRDESVQVCKAANPSEGHLLKSFFKRIGGRNKAGDAE